MLPIVRLTLYGKFCPMLINKTDSFGFLGKGDQLECVKRLIKTEGESKKWPAYVCLYKAVNGLQ